MKVIEGKGVALGMLASFVAKEALRGEEINVINCNQVIISGNYKMIKKEFEEKRSRFGHSQKGPKHPATSEKIVKRTIRGMLPNFRVGRGSEAFKRIKCFSQIPKEFQEVKPVVISKDRKIKYSEVKEFTKQK